MNFGLMMRLIIKGSIYQIRVSQAEISSKTYKSYYDIKSKNRAKGECCSVCTLAPDHNKIIMQWKGHFPVIGVNDNGVDYTIYVHGKKTFSH